MPSCLARATAWATTRTDDGLSEKAQVSRLNPAAATDRYPRGAIASGTGAECSSLSAVDPVTIRPSAPSADDPITSVPASSSCTASTRAEDTERPVTER